jgi:hypothetical protein
MDHLGVYSSSEAEGGDRDGRVFPRVPRGGLAPSRGGEDIIGLPA